MIYNIWLPHGLANCDVCEADFAVRVTLTRHIKTDRECNGYICRKRIRMIIQAEVGPYNISDHQIIAHKVI